MSFDCYICEKHYFLWVGTDFSDRLYIKNKRKVAEHFQIYISSRILIKFTNIILFLIYQHIQSFNFNDFNVLIVWTLLQNNKNTYCTKMDDQILFTKANNLWIKGIKIKIFI